MVFFGTRILPAPSKLYLHSEDPTDDFPREGLPNNKELVEYGGSMHLVDATLFHEVANSLLPIIPRVSGIYYCWQIVVLLKFRNFQQQQKVDQRLRIIHPRRVSTLLFFLRK